MNKYLNVIGILLVLLFFPYCGRHNARQMEGQGSGAHAALAGIDSLMWRQPDSAFAMLQEFVVSPEAKDLDEFNGHYCELLISELLYKNDWGQSNRTELLQAVAYFDSLVRQAPPLQRGSGGLKNTAPNRNDNLVFLNARAHYINGVGYYERDSVVGACAEYLKALETMEEYFEEMELVGHKARFLAYTYNRLGDLFSEQFMMESAITCYENALVYCKIEPTSPIGVSNILYRIGIQYDKKNEEEIAQSYFSEALENMTVTDNMVYRDIVASKALFDYKTGVSAEVSLDRIRRVLLHADNENERLHRYLTIGGIYFSEGNYDSALYYLEPVFENREVGLQDQASNYLYIVYDKLGDKELSDSLVHYMTSRKKLVGENKALVSRLEDMYKTYMIREQEKLAEIERQKAVTKVRNIIVPIAVVVVLVVICVLIQRNKKQLKGQQAEVKKTLADKEKHHRQEMETKEAEARKELEEKDKQHEEELRQRQAEAEKLLADKEKHYRQEMETKEAEVKKEIEERDRQHKEELKQRQAEAEKLLADKEKHHRQEMETKEAEARKELEEKDKLYKEELRAQKDLSEKEIEKTRKRHEKELETERLAYEKEQDNLKRSLKEREVQVYALEQSLNLQREKSKLRRKAFLKEPICQHILNEARSQQITSRDIAHELGIALKDKDFEQLREAVEKHYEGFDHELLSLCPSLKQGLLSLCHLHLLGLNESEIAALKNLSYSAIKKQNESLQERLGVENDVAAYILKMAEGLGVPQDVPQGVSQNVSQEIAQAILYIVSHNPKITREEIAQQLGVSSKTVGRYLKKLDGRIRYVGSGYSGHWEVVE